MDAIASVAHQLRHRRAIVAHAVARFDDASRTLDPAVVALREHVFGLLEREIARLRPGPGADAEAVARANGHPQDFSSIAFTFAPANDSAPDPMAQKLRANGVGSLDSADDAAVQELPIVPFRFWALAGSLFFQSMLRLQSPPAGPIQQSRSRTH